MRTCSDLAIYHHASCWSLVPHTFCAAINNGFLTTFPGLTNKLIKKHLPNQPATHKGHMKMSRQGVRSTKTNKQTPHAMTAPHPHQDSVQANLVLF